MKRKLVLILSLIFMFTILVGCKKEEAIKNIEIINLPDKIEIGTFDECNIKLNVIYSDYTMEIVDVKEKDIPKEYQHYLYEEGTHNFDYLYKGYEVKFKITMYEVKYTVKFINVLDEVVKEIKVKKNEKIEYPTKEEMYVEGYRFLETYDKEIDYATSDVEIKGNYVKTWVVKFYNGLNEVISTQIVDDKSSAQSPSEEDIKIDGYTFIMWDKGYTNITKNTNIFGIYEKGNATCVHNIVDATCTEPSYCTKCNKTFGDALGHDETDWIIDEDSTCTKEGTKHTECERCKETIQTTSIPTKQHNYTSTTINPTCTEQGYTLHTCTVCGNTYKDTYVKALGHDLVTETTPAICTQDGQERTYCKREGCTYEETRVLPAGHNYTTKVVNPTCTEQGYTLHTCTVCGNTYKDTYVKALGHDLVTETTPATCTQDGQERTYCKREGCTYEETKVLPAGHNYTTNVVNPTCEEEGYTLHTCTVCGNTYKDTYVDALGHDETDWIIDVNPTCQKEGTKHTECERCKETIQTASIPTIDHNYVNNKCTMCGKEKQVSLVPYKENGKTYINFGRYPQTVITDKNLINELDKITTTNSLGYIEYNGEEYKKQVADPCRSNSTFQNGNEVVDGATYYFLVEPIKWRVLETTSGVYKLLSEYILDAQQFYTSASIRRLNDKTIEANNYEYSNIRAWLNGYNGTSYNVEDYTNKGFIDIAFTEEEQELIKTTLVDNRASSTGNSENQHACDNTNDKIYLLSCKEAANTSYGFSSDFSRAVQPTDYAQARHCLMSSFTKYFKNGYWWLRSPHSHVLYSDSALYVNGRGNTVYDGAVKYYNGVRAALEINLTI